MPCFYIVLIHNRLIIMEHRGRTRAIEEVQAAESSGKRLLDEATKNKNEAIRDAEGKARGIIEEAKAAANAISEDILKNTDTALGHLRKKRIGEAEKEAAKLKRKKLGKAKLDRLADQAIKEIIGN